MNNQEVRKRPASMQFDASRMPCAIHVSNPIRRSIMTVGPIAFPRASELFQDDVFAPVGGILAQPVFVKIEALNAAGSVKIKTALNLINTMEAEGHIFPHSKIIESSSGNLGV